MNALLRAWPKSVSYLLVVPCLLREPKAEVDLSNPAMSDIEPVLCSGVISILAAMKRYMLESPEVE